jgi:hypothetical protein
MKQRKRADEAELLHPATKHLPRNKHVLMAREAIILDELWSGISPTSQEVTQAPFCAETPAAVDERAHSERQVQDVDTVRPQETGAAHTQEADAFTTLSKISTNPLQSVSTLESDSNKAKRCAFKQSVTEKIKIIKEQEKGVWKSQIPLPPTQINPIPPRASETTPSSATFKEPSRDPLHADQVKPALDAQHSVYRHVELPPCESLASGPVHSSSSLLTHTPVTETPMAMLLAPHGALLSQPYQAHGNPCGRSLFPAPPPTFAQSHIPAAVAPSSHMSFNSASQDMPSSDESPYQPNVSNIDLRSDRGIRPSDRMVLTGSDCANSKGYGRLALRHGDAWSCGFTEDHTQMAVQQSIGMGDTGRGDSGNGSRGLGQSRMEFRSGRGGRNRGRGVLGHRRVSVNHSSRGSVRRGNGRAAFQDGLSRQEIVARAFLTSYTRPKP